ncbi:Vacuolar ATP synthase subunit C [Tulasnella sp. JGI-2019a]|nr:Vacuolar ATP synthase subunit C [Tulasnella sp. JGI-2019a]KAG8993368.1 Vacuolar ATP synthase subunit C [Tulasnella sp. JGI-2019a]KAG9024790.1 Vacuolar ATP synthase subunit C [Tulasnella sp. JGI-2019a]
MPSEQATWLISVPDDSDAIGLQQNITSKLSQARATGTAVAPLKIPSLKTGTLDLLITLSEELPKLDGSFTGIVAKIVDTLRNLLNNEPDRLAQHIRVDERTIDEYLLEGWNWNVGKYGVQRGLRELVDILVKEMTSIDTVMKTKLNAYNLAKGSLVQMQRKKTGNLAVRSLAEIVNKDNFIPESEYMETLMVAVPKNSTKEWETKYERLATMVVPRSSTKIAADDDYALYSVVIFKKVHDDFAQKLRENKFILRDFTYSETLIQKQTQELEVAETTERELWTELLRLSRTNFSEAFQVIVHLKVVRLFVESVLRYGLPAEFAGLVIKPESKGTKKALSTLTDHFSYLSKRTNAKGRQGGTSTTAAEDAGEYATLMEQEYLDFVLFEVPWIV